MKAQFWSFDIVFAIVIFFTALILLVLFWSSISNQYISSYHNPSYNIKLAESTLIYELFSQGEPSNWNLLINLSNPGLYNFTPGLLNSKGSIDMNKLATLEAIANFNNSDYQLSKYLLHMPYDYFIEVKGSNLNITIGKNPFIYKAKYISSDIVPSEITNKSVNVIVYVWSNISA